MLDSETVHNRNIVHVRIQGLGDTWVELYQTGRREDADLASIAEWAYLQIVGVNCGIPLPEFELVEPFDPSLNCQNALLHIRLAGRKPAKSLAKALVFGFYAGLLMVALRRLPLVTAYRKQ